MSTRAIDTNRPLSTSVTIIVDSYANLYRQSWRHKDTSTAPCWSMNCYCPNGNCLFAAQSPTDNVDSQNFRNLSTPLTAYLVTERPMTALFLHLLFQCAGDITYPSSSTSTPNYARLMGLGEPISTARKRTWHVMLKTATNTLLKLAKQELSNKPRRPSGKQWIRQLASSFQPSAFDTPNQPSRHHSNHSPMNETECTD